MIDVRKPENVLIICHSFPPNPGVGGRRWAKFAKYLVQENIDVHVIVSKNVLKAKSVWTDDVADLDIKIEQLSLRYPKSLLRAPKSIMDKIKYRIGLMITKLLGKGNYYDYTIFWKRQLIAKAKEVIEKNNIQNVIITGAPFHLIYYGVFLKKLYPAINFIADFRDRWTDGKLIGLSLINEKRFKIEVQYELDVLNYFDFIISPADGYLNTLMRKIGEDQKHKFRHILHGFDKSDLVIDDEDIVVSNNIRITYAGTLYGGLDAYFKRFCECLKELKANNYQLYQKTSVELYSNEVFYKDYFIEKNIDIVKYKRQEPLKKIFTILNNSNFILLTLNEEFKNYFTSKFYEILALKKPIIYIGPMGDVGDFIMKNKCGVCLDLDNFEETFLSIYNDKKDFYQPLVDIEKFSFKSLTKELISILR